MEAKALDRPGKVKAAFGLLSALAHMHCNGFIHRDVKLENVMLDEANEAILIDFSLAKLLGDDDLVVGVEAREQFERCCG